MKAIIISDLHSDDKFTEERLVIARAQKPDVVFLLGDIKSTDLYKIEQTFWNENIQIPIYGITGDDDTPGIFDRFEHIEDIDGKIIDVCGIKVAGFAGSTVYKHGIFSMRTEEEASKILESLGKCDLFLSHETGCHYMDGSLKKKEQADALRVSMIEEQKKLINVKTKFQSFMDKILKNKDEGIAEHVKAEIVTVANEDKMYQGFDAIDKYIRRVQPQVHIFGHYHLPAIEIPESASIVEKTKAIEGRDITIKTVKVKTHKELAAFDVGNTTCACNYLFSVLEMGDRLTFNPIVTEGEIEDKKQTEQALEDKLFEDSYYVDLTPKERKAYDERHKQ